jgi:hypothetical protein
MRSRSKSDVGHLCMLRKLFYPSGTEIKQAARIGGEIGDIVVADQADAQAMHRRCSRCGPATPSVRVRIDGRRAAVSCQATAPLRRAVVPSEASCRARRLAGQHPSDEAEAERPGSRRPRWCGRTGGGKTNGAVRPRLSWPAPAAHTMPYFCPSWRA